MMMYILLTLTQRPTHTAPPPPPPLHSPPPLTILKAKKFKPSPAKSFNLILPLLLLTSDMTLLRTTRTRKWIQSLMNMSLLISSLIQGTHTPWRPWYPKPTLPQKTNGLTLSLRLLGTRMMRMRRLLLSTTVSR